MHAVEDCGDVEVFGEGGEGARSGAEFGVDDSVAGEV